MIINAFGVFGMTLEPTADTAPEGMLRCAVDLVGTTEQWQEIAHHTALGVLLGKNMII